MEQSDLLRFVVEAIERVGLQYFVTGSTVTIFYGEPRFTNDIDIVVNLSPPLVRKFLSQFPDDKFYASEEAAMEAVSLIPVQEVSTTGRDVTRYLKLAPQSAQWSESLGI